MNVRILALIACLWSVGTIAFAEQEALPAAVQEALDAFEREAVVIHTEFDDLRTAHNAATAETLARLQDQFSKDAKLDEAVAARDLARNLDGASSDRTKLPPELKALMVAFGQRMAELERKQLERVAAVGKRIGEPLQAIVDQFCREGKLDEALAVRDVMRRMSGSVVDVEPDPGNMYVNKNDIGKVRFYQVIGRPDGTIWGTDVYTGDSRLAAAAVHVGAVQVGEKAVVRVTVVKGLDEYRGSFRNGVTSQPYSAWEAAFRVERAYGVFRVRGETANSIR